jgi:hypothetical protein
MYVIVKVYKILKLICKYVYVLASIQNCTHLAPVVD